MDEITATADLPAILEAAGCGVSLLATVHGNSADDLKKKRMFQELFSYDIFQKAVCIQLHQGRRVYTVMDL
jgi:stage III sporulation protein AA